MKYKKSLLVFCLIMCILFTVSSVTAGDVNDTAIASEDTTINEEVNLPLETANEETIISEESDDISNDALAIEENSKDVLNIDDNKEIELKSEAITGDNAALASQINDDDVLSAGNTQTVKISFYKQTGKFLNDKKVYIKITDAKTGKLINMNDFIEITTYNHKTDDEWFEHVDISHGKGVLEWSDTSLGLGVFTIKTDLNGQGYYNNGKSISLKSNVAKATVKVYRNNVKIIAKKITIPKKSKKAFVVRVLGQNKKPIDSAEIRVVIFTGNKYVVKHIMTDKNGYAAVYKVSKLSPGTHKVKVLLDFDTGYSNNDGLYGKTVTSSITVGKPTPTKQSVTIGAKKMSAKYKAKKYFKAKVVNTKTKKPLKGIPVNMIIYTGKNAKVVTLKSNAKGMIAYPTSKLSVGTHKVVLKVKKNKHYTGKATKSVIKIKKAKNKNSGSNKKTNTNTRTKGKLRTTISIQECYRTDGMAEYYFKICLKDSAGKRLANREIQIKTKVYVFGSSMTLSSTATTDSSGIASGYLNCMLGGVTEYEPTFIFTGDGSHYGSTASKYIG